MGHVLRTDNTKAVSSPWTTAELIDVDLAAVYGETLPVGPTCTYERRMSKGDVGKADELVFSNVLALRHIEEDVRVFRVDGKGMPLPVYQRRPQDNLDPQEIGCQ